LRRLVRIALACVAVASLFALLTLGAFWWYIVRDLPQITSLRDYKPKLITRILAADGTEIGSLSEERRIVVPIETIPDHVLQAFVASEDDRFYEHKGIDYGGIVRAMLANLRAGGIKQGGSTITQQVAKTFLLSSDRSYIRKVKDMILAMRIEKFLDKNEILYLYVNQIYLGSGAYGIEAAAREYFGKHASDLTLAEAAVIVGVVPAPSKYTPRRAPKRAKERQELVLRRMREERFIDDADYRAAVAEPLILVPEITTTAEVAGKYFVEEARRWSVGRYGEEKVLTGGLVIQTTMDIAQQVAAWQSVRRGLRAHSRRVGYKGALKNVPRDGWKAAIEEIGAEPLERPKPGEGSHRKALVTAVDDAKKSATIALAPDREARLQLADMKWARKPDAALDGAGTAIGKVSQALAPGDLIEVEVLARDPDGTLRYGLYQEPPAEGALLAMEVNTGKVPAMIGGYDFDRSQFNRALQARRQPGSAFKPFIYAEALRHGFTPATIVYDTPMVFEDDLGTWKPKNYTYSFSGPITIREALAKSKNISTIKILQSIGVQPVIERVRALGIQSELEPNLALALGSSGVTLAELVRAYAAFPSGGKLLDPVFISEVKDRSGKVLDANVSLLGGAPEPWADQETVAVDPEPTEPASATGQVFASVAMPPSSTTGEAGAPIEIPPGHAIDPQSAYLMVDMMRAVVEEGTGQRAKALGRPIAGKTGTTNDLYDAWFVGYSPTIVTGTWVGYDTVASLGANETGSRAAAPIFVDFRKVALQNEPRGTSFPVPPGIEFHRIDKTTGLLARGGEEGIFQPFRAGTQPTEYDPETTSTPEGGTRTIRAPRLD
jgi:penicillin-binding protein 1A